jgi:hypothetical protein
MKNLWLSLAFLLLIPVAAAQAPVCLYQDVLSGPASGGGSSSNAGMSGNVSITGGGKLQ